MRVLETKYTYSKPLPLPVYDVRVVFVVALQVEDVLSIQRMIVTVQDLLQDLIDASETDLAVFAEVVRREEVKVVPEVLGL